MKKFSVLFSLVIVVFLGVVGLNSADMNATDFTAKDIQGKNVTLSDYKDKLVVLDFWATWCGPCRKEIPNLIDIKNTFKAKKFEIISVNGFERDDSAAVQFVKDQKMNWVHIIDKQVGKTLAEKYNVTFIPSMFLIKDGKIIASGLRGEELKKKIAELLK